MRLRVDIDLDNVSGDVAKEVGRILRYWGGNLTEDLLEPGLSQDLYDSSYAQPVGKLTVHES